MKAKKNVILIFGIIALTPLVFLVCEMMARNISNIYTQKYALFEKECSDVETLILGSSHALYGINPAYFDSKTFNLSMASQTLNYDYYILKDYLPKCKHLKRVILIVSTFSFHLIHGIDNDKAENARKYLYLHYTPLSPPPECFDTQKENFSYYKYHFAIGSTSIPQALKAFFNPRHMASNDGFLPNKSIVNETDLMSSGRQASLRHQGSHKDSEDILKNFNYLEKIIEILQANNIELILVTTPTHFEYSRHFDQKYLGTFFEAISSSAEKYDFKYYNYFLGEQFGFKQEDYWDADHLNIHGAEKLSRLLNSHITD